jgi:hypothetical protein
MPIAVILATFKPTPVTTPPVAQLASFIQHGGNGITDLLLQISNSQCDLSSSKLYGWYTLDPASPSVLAGLQKGTPADQVWLTETINVATKAPGAKKVDLSPFSGIIVVVDGDTSTTGATATTLGQVMAISSMLPIAASGGGDIVATGEFVDAVTQAVINILDPTGQSAAPAGEIINTPSLQKLGILPANRITTFPQSLSTTGTSTTSTPKTTSFTLAALDQPLTTGSLMARIRVQDGSSYTIEYRPFQLFRPQSQFSPPRTILINKANPVVKFEDGWRECGRCQCLVYTGNSQCTDGQGHSFDMSGKGYYLDATNGIWNRCGGCGDLFSGTTGVCVAEGNHVAVDGEKYNISLAPPPRSPSPPSALASPVSIESLTLDGTKGKVLDGTPPRQQPPPKPEETWRQCLQCHGLVYFGTGTAPVSSSLPCANGKQHVLGTDKFILLDPISGQPLLWRKCSKCSCLCWLGNLLCWTGGCHVFGSRNYLLSYRTEEKFDTIGVAATVAVGGTFKDGSGVVVKVGAASADSLSVSISVSVS